MISKILRCRPVYSSGQNAQKPQISAPHILVRTYPKREREKIVSHITVAVKLRHRKISKTAVPDLNENIGGSADLAKKLHGWVALFTPINPPLLRKFYSLPLLLLLLLVFRPPIYCAVESSIISVISLADWCENIFFQQKIPWSRVLLLHMGLFSTYSSQHSYHWQSYVSSVSILSLLNTLTHMLVCRCSDKTNASGETLDRFK